MKYKIKTGLLLCTLIIGLLAFSPSEVKAASGKVYTCTIHPTYQHPVSGEIEDSGGSSAQATGQGMVESAIDTTGIMEVTDDGEYYLTIRLKLKDYTSDESFWVQNWGDSDWTAPAMGVTQEGSGDNGSTEDVCIQVPAENCVVRGSMYVTPMGRDVVFYCYPSDLTEGNSTDMVVTMVTEESSGDSAETSDTSEDTENSESSSDSDSSDSQESETTATPEVTQAAETTVTATPAAEASDDTEEAEGLSLSTASDETEEGTETSKSSISGLELFFIVFVAVVLAGLVLMGILAVILYFNKEKIYSLLGRYPDDETVYEEDLQQDE